MELQIMDIIVSIIVVVLTLAGLWKVFEKAGRKGWEGIIPIYNQYVMLRITGLSGWWIATYLLPIVPLVVVSNMNIAVNSPEVPPVVTALAIIVLLSGFIISVVQTIINYEMARSYGKGLAYTFGLIFFPFVFWPILGFGDAVYEGMDSAEESADEPEADTDTEEVSEAEDGASDDAVDNEDAEDHSSDEEVGEADEDKKLSEIEPESEDEEETVSKEEGEDDNESEADDEDVESKEGKKE